VFLQVLEEGVVEFGGVWGRGEVQNLGLAGLGVQLLDREQAGQ
jgi:hypothetical protein